MANSQDEPKLPHAVAFHSNNGPSVALQSPEVELSTSVEEVGHDAVELTRANRRLLLLNQLANSFILGDHPQEQLNAAFDAFAEELGAKYYFNYRTDATSPDTLILESSRGVEQNEKLAIRQIRFGQYLCGQVAQTRRPLIVENVHLLCDEATAGVRAMGIKAYAGLPLIAHGQLFGTIALGSNRQTHFEASDIAFLQTLADQSAAMLDRTRLLQNVRESEATLTAFFETATIGLHWVGPDGIILRANKSELELLGYSHDEYVGHHIAGFHASKEAIDDILARLSRDEKLHDYEARLRCKDGSLKIVQINSSGFWKDGNFVHSRCFTRDITEHTRAKDALQESEARLLHAAQAAGLTYVDVDMIEGLIQTPSNFAAVMGYATLREEAIEQAVGVRLLLEHVVADDRSRVQAALEEFLTGSVPGKIEYRVLGDDQIERCIETAWSAEHGADGKSVRAFATNLDITDRKLAQQHAKLLMSEVSHRSKNLLTVVQAIARQTSRRGDPATFVARLSERIDGLAAVQDLLVKNEWKGIGVADLIAAQLAHFKDLIGTRVLIDGPPARLTPAAAQGVGMALHELATNAAKYGALSNTGGRVHINWQISATSTPEFVMTWFEHGGPTVAPPTHQGFGRMVIGRMAELAVGGTAEIDYRECGLCWKLCAPAKNTLEPEGSVRTHRAY